MELLERLIDLGYEKEKAQKIIDMYIKNNTLNELKAFICVKEMCSNFSK